MSDVQKIYTIKTPNGYRTTILPSNFAVFLNEGEEFEDVSTIATMVNGRIVEIDRLIEALENLKSSFDDSYEGLDSHQLDAYREAEKILAEVK